MAILRTYRDLKKLVEQYGMLPLFCCALPGFSAEDLVPADYWWTGDRARDPWEWRIHAASDPELCYGKLFAGKAGFLSRRLLPDFCNFRRNGYDFDSLYEEGLVSRRLALLMNCYPDLTGAMPSYQLKKEAGFGGKDGEKGFDGAVTKLQMMTYLTISGFSRRKNRLGQEYGWHVGQLTPMEQKFGALPRAAYHREPQESLQILIDALKAPAGAGEDAIARFLQG